MNIFNITMSENYFYFHHTEQIATLQGQWVTHIAINHGYPMKVKISFRLKLRKIETCSNMQTQIFLIRTTLSIEEQIAIF